MGGIFIWTIWTVIETDFGKPYILIGIWNYFISTFIFPQHHILYSLHRHRTWPAVRTLPADLLLSDLQCVTEWVSTVRRNLFLLGNIFHLLSSLFLRVIGRKLSLNEIIIIIDNKLTLKILMIDKKLLINDKNNNKLIDNHYTIEKNHLT